MNPQTDAFSPRWTLALLLLLLLCGAAKGRAENALPFPEGFGRFGRLNEDGLLTLNVTPQGFTTPPLFAEAPLMVRFGDGRMPNVTVTRLDATGKTLRLSHNEKGAPDGLRYTLLYPGFTAHYGRSLHLTFGEDKSRPARMAMERLPNARHDGFACFLLRRVDKPGVPLALALRSPASHALRPVLFVQGGQTRLRIQQRQNIGDVVFLTPHGLRPLPPRASPQELARLRQDALAWARRGVPVRQRAEYALAPDGKTVRVTERYTSANGEPYAPLPPVLAFARRHGYPVRVYGPVVETDCATQQGDFAFVRGHVLRYDLPVPPTEERGYIRVENASNADAGSSDNVGEAADFTGFTDSPTGRVRLLNDLVGHLGGDWATNAVDLGYAGMANAQMAWAYLTPARRAEVSAAWKQYLPRAFRLPPYPSTEAKPAWHVETEPFTRQSYLWTYFIDGPAHRRYDLDWGDALPLYGLYKYAQYTGDWAFVRRHWPDARRVTRYFDLGDDWAWMTVVNADHGYSTGTGDPMAATYGGMLACLKMARALHDRQAEAHYACQAARIAVPVVARFWYTAWARHQHWLAPHEIVLGFHETEAFTTAALGTQDPWSATNVLSGDGVLPEVYAALLAFGSGALRDYENEYARSYPAWYEGSASYSFETTYKGNSVYVTFPHIYARAALNEIDANLWRYVAAAQSNRNNAWVGPNVLAELLSRSAPLRLTEWQPAAYEDGYVTPDGRSVHLKFRFARPCAWRIAAQVTRPPVSVRVNGKTVAFTCRNLMLSFDAQVKDQADIDIAF